MGDLETEDRAASADEQRTLAAWSSWGAVPAVFDEDRGEWATARAELRELLGADGYASARRTTINAHYTDPAVVVGIWETVAELGFDGGRVLEPGCGAGVFLGLAPASAELTGVELDPTSARLARALYPHATVRTESFADTRLPAGHFDLAVGNVPFADVRLHDQQHNRGQHSIHNHFILKALALTRPGGLVAVLSSRFTLDAGNPTARREMADLADLVGAVRLPTGSHRRTAGTDAVMDLLILRRRDAGEQPADLAWENTQPVDVDGQQVRINAWLAAHPEMILGRLAVGRGMYANDTLHVRPDWPLQQTAQRLRAAGELLVDRAREHHLTAGPRDTSRTPAAASDLSQPVALAPEGEWDGHIVAREDRTFALVVGGVQEPLSVPGTQAWSCARCSGCATRPGRCSRLRRPILKTRPPWRGCAASSAPPTRPTLPGTGRSTGTRCGAPAAPTRTLGRSAWPGSRRRRCGC